MTERAVIVGVGQMRRKPPLDGDWAPLEPAAFVAECLRRAAADAGRPELLQEADGIGWIHAVAWGYEDSVGRLCRFLDRPAPRVGWQHPAGGANGVEVLNAAAERIAEGEIEIALVGGGEVLYSLFRALREGRPLGWPPGCEDRAYLFEGQRPLTNELEDRHGLQQPIHLFPFLESALRAELGHATDEHLRYMAELFRGYSEVAAENPYSWFPEPRSVERMATVDERNRWVCFPYPKLLNAIWEVDQGAAAIVMAESAADRLGIAPEKRVHLIGGGRALDAWCVSERPFLTRSPGHRAAAEEACRRAAIELDDVDLFDLYNCFPCALELALKALELDPDDPRGFTRTGGLPHHGGPGNSYALHGVCNVVEALRRGEGRVGWVSGLGMVATKHAVCVLSNDPERIAAAEGRAGSVSLPPELVEGPELAPHPQGSATVEGYTVVFGRNNEPEKSVFLLRLDDGRRTLAHGVAERDALLELTRSQPVGRRGRVSPGKGNAPNFFVFD